MTNSTTQAFEIRRHFAASPDRVFECFRDPALLREWAAPDEHVNEAVEQDFVVGGRYRREMRFPDGSQHVLSGEYHEITPPSRLTYSYHFETLPFPPTRVEISLVPNANGGTDLHLVHSGFVDPDFAAGHEAGWAQCFAKLDRVS